MYRTHANLYSLCCSDELPSLLTLPAVLATASSTQNLASLALLGKSEYHMMMMMMMMVMMMVIMMMMMMMMIVVCCGSSAAQQNRTKLPRDGAEVCC